MATRKKEGDTLVDTGGGNYIGGDVNTGGGDFVARDKITNDHSIKTNGPVSDAILNTGDNNQLSNRAEQHQEGATLEDFLKLLTEIKAQAAEVGIDASKQRGLESAEAAAKASTPDRDEILHQLERLDNALQTVENATEAGKKLAAMVSKALAWARGWFGSPA